MKTQRSQKNNNNKERKKKKKPTLNIWSIFFFLPLNWDSAVYLILYSDNFNCREKL